MTRNLKVLGLALVAMFTLGAVTASSAFAVDHFTAEKEKAVLTSTVSENNVFKITTGAENPPKVECKTSKFSGTFVTSATTVTVFPTYKGTVKKEVDENHCTFGAGKAEVELNGCDYDLTGETTKEDKTGKVGKDAVVSVTCPKEKEITVKTNLGCTLHIPEQTPTEGGVVYTNITHLGKKAIEVTATVTGITYTSTGALCGAAGISSEGNNADYTGTVIGTCYEDLGNGEKTDEFKEGAQIGCESS